MSRMIAPGPMLDACRYWYPEPLRTRKLILAGCAYLRAALDGNGPGQMAGFEEFADTLTAHPDEIQAERRLGSGPDQFAYNALWRFGPPIVVGSSHGDLLNGITLCVFGALNEDASKRSPEVTRFDPNWRTEHTVGLALRMYDDRDFAAMPILADALEEAGCDSQDILTHCREPGVHVRGCWVVDLVLGKA